MIDHLRLAKEVQRGYKTESGSTWGVEWNVLEIADEIVVTFRGSDDAFDWVRNFLAFPYRGRFCFLGHYGYVRAGERALKNGLALWMKRYFGTKTPITFAGHSAGVQSLACALMFKDMGFCVKEWVGFGCPRMWVWPDPLPFPSTHYIIEGDIVPWAPPWFKHRGKTVYLKRVVPGIYPDWSNHKIELYIKRIEEQLRCQL